MFQVLETWQQLSEHPRNPRPRPNKSAAFPTRFNEARLTVWLRSWRYRKHPYLGGGKFIHVRSQQIHLEMKHFMGTYIKYVWLIIYTWNLFVLCFGAKKTLQKEAPTPIKTGITWVPGIRTSIRSGFISWTHRQNQFGVPPSKGRAWYFNFNFCRKWLAIESKNLPLTKNTGFYSDQT